MKKSSLIKALVTVILIALVAIFPISVVSAAEQSEWTLNESGNVLTDGETEYERHAVPYGFKAEKWREYYLQISLDFSEYKMKVSSFGVDDSVLFVEDGTDYYATAETQQALESYFAGNGGKYYLSDTFGSSGTAIDDPDTFDDAYAVGQKTSVNVTTLPKVPYARIIRVDDTMNFSEITGEFYLIDGKLYYVDLSALPNNAFDADGRLSHRSGEISMLLLDKDLSDRVYALAGSFTDFKDLLPVREEEEPQGRPDEYKEEAFSYAVQIFWLALLGILLPLAAIVWSVVLMIRNKKKFNKKLLLVIIPATVWLAVGTVIFIILL